MRKLNLTIEVELDVLDGVEDHKVFEAICNQFAGNGEGLHLWPGNGEQIAAGHDITIRETTGKLWGASMSPTEEELADNPGEEAKIIPISSLQPNDRFTGWDGWAGVYIGASDDLDRPYKAKILIRSSNGWYNENFEASYKVNLGWPDWMVK